jgi:hypothetical protein
MNRVGVFGMWACGAVGLGLAAGCARPNETIGPRQGKLRDGTPACPGLPAPEFAAGDAASAAVPFEVARSLPSLSGQTGKLTKIVDMNADGHPDIVALEPRTCGTDSSFLATVRLGRGDGTFEDPIATLLFSQFGVTVDLEVVDLDGDGNLDVAATLLNLDGPTIGRLAILVGDGTGQLTTRRLVDLGGNSSADQPHMVSLDLDGNTLRDLVVSMGMPGDLRTFHDVAGAAEPIVTTEPLGGRFYVRQLAARDLDGDGKADVAVLGYDWLAEQGTVLLARVNDGAGNLVAPVLPGGAKALIDVGAFGFAFTTWNEPGAPLPRIAVATTGGIRSWAPTGPLAYGPPATLASLFGGASLNDFEERFWTGDLDGDGRADLVFTGQADPVHLLFGDGAGGIAHHAALDTGYTNDVESGDLDGDGDGDLVASGNTIKVVEGKGAGAFAAPRIPFVTNEAPEVIGPIDLNGDGPPDFALISGLANTVTPALGAVTGDLVPGTPVTLPGLPGTAWTGIVVGSPGAQALAVPMSGNDTPRVATFRVQGGDLVGSTLLDLPGALSDGGIQALFSGHFAAPGATQLLVAYLIGYVESTNSNPFRVASFPMAADGSFGAPTIVKQSDEWTPVLGTLDANGDGRTDFISQAAPTDGHAVFEVNISAANGTFTVGGTFDVPGEALDDRYVATGDLTGDGRDDVVMGMDACPELAYESCLAVLRNDGGGNFSRIGTYDLNADQVEILDVNGDGFNDIVLGSGWLSVILNSPAGLGPKLGEPGAPVDRFVVADVNTDGKLDLVTSSRFGVEVVFNNAPVAQGLPSGASCSAAATCASHLCVDGVCCAAACGGGDAGDCQACSMASGASANGACETLPMCVSSPVQSCGGTGCAPVTLPGPQPTVDQVTIRFSESISPGAMSARPCFAVSQPTDGYRIVDNPTNSNELACVDLEISDAVGYSHARDIQVCLVYPNAILDDGQGGTLDETKFELYHDDGNGWLKVTTSRTPGANRICGLVRSLSPFAVVYPVDKTPPVLKGVPTTPIVAYATRATGANVTYPSITATDAIDGKRPVKCTTSSSAPFPLGKTTVSCSAADKSGNVATGSFTVSVQVQAPTDGSFFLAPIRANGKSIFRIGRPVPVRFRPTGASAGITDLTAKLAVTKLSNTVTGTTEDTSDETEDDNDFVFKYRPLLKWYAYRWKTRTETQGTYRLTADLGDGVEHTIVVSLKK